MVVNHRIMSLVFAFGVGLLVSFLSYQWISNPERAEKRAIEEAVVRESRLILESVVSNGASLELSDPLNRVREAGKVYIYPLDDGWEVSGHYRRTGEKRWRPYLMVLNGESSLVSMSVQDDDPAVALKAMNDAKLTITERR
ncbi:MAG: hypothetical protein P8M18_05335 [Woeseiaceae bacterium]|nr:hypothetical protein [Woeseiaceae bacterium]